MKSRYPSATVDTFFAQNDLDNENGAPWDVERLYVILDQVNNASTQRLSSSNTWNDVPNVLNQNIHPRDRTIPSTSNSIGTKTTAPLTREEALAPTEKQRDWKKFHDAYPPWRRGI